MIRAAAEMVHVGMAEMAASNGDLLCCHGLGSCVAVALWDAQALVGGLAHVMLPDSSAALKSPRSGGARYADTAIPELVRRMQQLGSRGAGLQARLVGGANMFTFAGREHAPGSTVGERNLAAVEAALAGLGLKAQAKDTGGAWGRSLEFNTKDGSLLVRTAQHGNRRL